MTTKTQTTKTTPVRAGDGVNLPTTVTAAPIAFPDTVESPITISMVDPVVALLTEAKELIADKKHWTTGKLVSGPSGYSYYNLAQALRSDIRFCSLGALYAAEGFGETAWAYPSIRCHSVTYTRALGCLYAAVKQTDYFTSNYRVGVCKSDPMDVAARVSAGVASKGDREMEQVERLVYGYNDGHNHTEVMRVWDQAIKLAHEMSGKW